MQNVLLSFPHEVTVKAIAEVLTSELVRVEYSEDFPDRAVLINDGDHVFLYRYHNVKESYDEWFDKSQHDLVMSMETYIEFQYLKLKMCSMHW